jgi:acylpyruvate hydrolase
MKIICIGRNYQDHAKEMNSPVPSKPIFFMKPDTALHKEKDWYHPEFTQEVHYEVELVVKINKVGKYISKENAPNYYEQIGLGIDFTARDLQKECKEKGLPWECAKAFDQSAVLGNEFMDKKVLNLADIDFSLQLNGETVQKGNSKDMIFSIDDIITYVSQFITLKTGDLIFTGTPVGVGKVKIGDKLEGFISNQSFFTLNVK